MSRQSLTRIILRSAGGDSDQAVLVNYGDTWTYLEGAVGHDPGFEIPGYDVSSWNTGPAAFGYVLDGDQVLGPNMPPCVMNRDLIGTAWTPLTDLTLVKTINIPDGVENLYFEFGSDNMAIIYLDGNEVGRTDTAGCQTRGSSSFWYPNSLSGSTVLAVRMVDNPHGEPGENETFFDMKVVAYGTFIDSSPAAPSELLAGKTVVAGQSGTAPGAGCGVYTPANPSRITDGELVNPYSEICDGVTTSEGLRTGYWVIDLGSAVTLGESQVFFQSAGAHNGSGNGFVRVYASNTGTSGPWTLVADHGQWGLLSPDPNVATVTDLTEYQYVKLSWELPAPGGINFYVGIRLVEWRLMSNPSGVEVTEDFTPTVDRGPGPQVALILDAKKIGVSEYHNSPGEIFFTLPNNHPQIATIIPWKTHYDIQQYRAEGWTTISQGWIRDWDSTDQETVFYGIDYLGVLSLMYDERFNPEQTPDAAALIWPEDSAGLAGSKYVDQRIDVIVGDQINRAIHSPSSPIGFMQLGQIDSMSETLTIYSQFKERLAFVSGLIDSHRAGSGLRTRVMVNRYTTWTSALERTFDYRFDVFNNPGEDRPDLSLEYGGLIQGYRVIPFGDFGTRALGIGKTITGLRLEYDVEPVPPPDGEPDDFYEREYGRLSKINFWEDIIDLNDLKRRVRQYATRVGAIGKQVGLGLRSDTLGIKDGWDIGDSVPVVIQRGPVDTTTMGSGYWTIWGWAALIHDDGHTDLVLSLTPKEPAVGTDADISSTQTVTPVPPVSVHDTDPDTTVPAGSQGTWVNSTTGHVWRVDPETGLWYDATAAGEFTALGSAVAEPVPHGSMGSTETLDFGDGNWHTGTLTADCTITVTGYTVDQGLVAIFKVTQDGTGGWGITWDGDVIFIGDDQPTQTAESVTWYLLWSDEGDGTIYASKVGSTAFGSPAIVLGSSPSDGVAETMLRTDATIVAFDDVDPQAPAVTADPGVAAFAARSDHIHPEQEIPEPDTTGDHEHIIDLFSGDGTTTVFELSQEPLDPETVFAFVAGTWTAITVSGTMNTVITFGSAPASGTNNVALHYPALVA